VILTHYDPSAEAKVSADASLFGLGAVLLQKTSNTWKPVAFASRTMSETECRYTQIEKEALAVARACDKFSDYLLGHTNGLLLYDQRIVVPASLQQETLEKLHTGHQGIQRCRLRAQSSVWWPNISSQIQSLIQNCPTCLQYRNPHKEPMLSNELPEYPWQKVGSDLFELNGVHYLLVVDYFSRFVEISKMSSTTSASINQLLNPYFRGKEFSWFLLVTMGHNIPQRNLKNFHANTTSSTLQGVPITPKGMVSRTHGSNCERTVKPI